MEEPTQSPIENVPEKPYSKTKLLLMLIAVFVLITAAAGSSYLWEHGKVNNLNSQIQMLRAQSVHQTAASQPAKSSKSAVTPTTFTYKPQTGGLTLVLPVTYGVIVNVDGNAGGAPGAIFRVASVSAANEFIDAAYQGLQVNIDNTFTNLNNAVQSEESELSSQTTQAREYQVSDTKVAGLPAKLIKVRGLDEYQGNVSVYIVGAGSYLYKFTANGTQGEFPLLDAVLNGTAIKPVTF